MGASWSCQERESSKMRGCAPETERSVEGADDAVLAISDPAGAAALL